MRVVLFLSLFLFGCVSAPPELSYIIDEHQRIEFAKEQERRAKDMMSVDAVLGVEGNHADNQSSK